MTDEDALLIQDSLFVRAASGDAAAFDLLARMALAMDDIPARERLAGAEMLARLASANGDPSGSSLLAGVLLYRAADLRDDDPERAGILEWEAIGLLEALAAAGDQDAAASLLAQLSQMADTGDDAAALGLNHYAERFPDSLPDARRLSEAGTESVH